MLSDDETPVEVNNVTIPSWVIWFVGLILAMSVFGFIYFHRYTKSIHDYKFAISAYQEGDFETAEKYSASASALVPDNKEFLSLMYYISGIKNYSESNFAEALEFLEKYLSYESDDAFIDELVTSMKISNAFEDKDYSLMADLSEQLYSNYSDEPQVILQYASALACKYADSENSDDYNKALELIETARTYELDDSNIDYIKRIEYRLSTKNIISKAEYMQLEEEGKL